MSIIVASFSPALVLMVLLGCLYADTSYSFVLKPSSVSTTTKTQEQTLHLPQYFYNDCIIKDESKLSRLSLIRNSDNGDVKSSKDNDTTMDFLITDSLELKDEDRPTVWNFLFQEFPREGFIRLPFLLCGAALSLCNIGGLYEEELYASLVVACCALGLVNALLDTMETKGITTKNIRRGSIDPKVLSVYAGTYSASVCWLALRVYPPVCPEWLPKLDPLTGALTSVLFLASLVVPLLTLFSDNAPENSFLEKTQIGLVRLCRGDPTIQRLPRFTPIEQYRTAGLLVIGFVACLYLPVSFYLALYGEKWWATSLERYPQQGLLETSTALFGLIAAQSNICITRAAGYGVRPVGECVQLGAGACLVLTVVPCASALYFLRSGTTFFEHYQYLPQS